MKPVKTTEAQITRLAKLDSKDRQILSALDWDARTPNTKLAKTTRLSKNAVAYRIRKMEDAGIILGYYPIINFERLGFSSRRVFLTLQNVDANIKQEMEEYISEPRTKISWSVWTRGSADLIFVIWARSLKEFKLAFNKFNSRFGQYIKTRVFQNTYGFEQYPYGIITGKREPWKIVIDEISPVDIDKIDAQILKELNTNARKSCTEIASSIKSNYKTVQYRIKKLEKMCVLLGTRALVNHHALGYTHYKLLLYFNEYSDEMYNKIKSYVQGLVETCYVVYNVDSDLDFEIMFRSDNEFFDFIDLLNEKFPGCIKNTEYYIFNKTIKIEYLLLTELKK